LEIIFLKPSYLPGGLYRDGNASIFIDA